MARLRIRLAELRLAKGPNQTDELLFREALIMSNAPDFLNGLVAEPAADGRDRGQIGNYFTQRVAAGVIGGRGNAETRIASDFRKQRFPPAHNARLPTQPAA